MSVPPLPIEDELRQLSEELTAPRASECLMCYIARQLSSFGCSGTLRWARHWRDLRVPSATGLERRLAARGACCCDCEVFLNGWTLRDDLLVLRPGCEDPEWPAQLPECATVSARSSQPCAVWAVRRRGWW